MKKYLPHQTSQRPRRRATSGRRGSAIVLVLVSCLLMAVLAASLLQVTRFERIPQPTSNIDAVVESVVAEILNQATSDILDDDGNTFHVGAFNSGGGDEPWDFPYTNTSVNQRSAIRANGNPVNNILGGVMDDTWLASTMPDFRNSVGGNSIYATSITDSTNGVWRKITSLTGIYLKSNDGNIDFSNTEALDSGNEDVMTATAFDSNIRTNSQLLVDADGDGIGDSRWEWAPLRQIGSTQYMMAVRIIDLSARLDVNVATGRVDTSGEALPRGDSPAELNGNVFAADAAQRMGLAANTGTNEWRDALNARMGGSGATGAFSYDGNSTNPGNRTRRGYWTDSAALVSNNYQRSDDAVFDAAFGLNDAFELLYRNGLNNATTTALEDQMPSLLRDGDAETGFPRTGTQTINPNGGGTWDRRDFWERDARKFLSPLTGSMAVAPPRTTTGEQAELRLDVNRALEQGRLDLIDRVIRETINAGNGTALLSEFPHLNTGNPALLADQLTANIADYADRDNLLTRHGDAWGFEALPFITEVYTQRVFDGQVTQAPSPTDPTKNEVTWTAPNDHEVGYIIEIGNPFGRYEAGEWVGRPVSLENVWLKLGSNAPFELTSRAGVPNRLEAGEVLYLYRDSTGNNNGGDDDLDDFFSDAQLNDTGNIDNADVTVVNGPALPTPANGELTISLHAENESNPDNALSWAYSACDIEFGTDDVTEELDPTDYPGPPGDQTFQAYVQTSYKGIGEGPRMMTVAADQADANSFAESENLDTPSDNSNGVNGTPANAATRSIKGAFAHENKPGEPTGFGSLNDGQFVWHDNPRDRLQWIGDILQIPLIGPNANAAANPQFAASFALANPTTPEDLLLPYRTVANNAPVINDDSSTAPGGTFGLLNLPHSLMLLERLTTFNPATDGEDGDGQNDSESFGSPDYDELLVPGKLNLNTAPFEVLASALPFPDENTRLEIARAIIDRREHDRQNTDYGVGADDLPGLPYVSSLYEQLEGTIAPGLSTSPSQMSGDTAEIGSPAYRVDLNDYETTQGNFPPAAGALFDGVADDREEQIMLTKWLNEVGSTRSDLFAAYIVVQGYPADNFQEGAVESARLIVLFSRAGVREDGDRAVEIGRLRIK